MGKRLFGITLALIGTAIAVLSALVWFFVPLTNGKPPYAALAVCVLAIFAAQIGWRLFSQAPQVTKANRLL
jgi:hypothetical protein